MAKTTTSINDLPPELLTHILTRIPTLDAIRSTLLVSPKWHNLWHQIPTLDLDMSLYHSPPKTLSESRESFARLVTKIFHLRPKSSTPLHSFRLVFNYRHFLHTQLQVDSWIQHAITSGIKILRLSFEEDHFIKSEDDTFARYDFHFKDGGYSSDEDLDCSSIWLLDLGHCRIIWPINVPVGGFLSLTYIYLHSFSIKEKELSAMVSNCVNLTFLGLSCIIGLRNFKIHSESLEELGLGYFEPTHSRKTVGSLDICAPNLSKIVFENFYVKKYHSRDLSSLVEAAVDFVEIEYRETSYCMDILELLSGVDSLNVPTLNVNQNIMFEVTENGFSDLSILMNLKHIELRTGYHECDLVRVGKISKLCPVLETLVLDSVEDKDGSWGKEYKKKPLILEIPSLKQVEMKNYNGSENELYFVEVLKTHKVVLQKIVAYPRKVNGILPPPIVFLGAS